MSDHVYTIRECGAFLLEYLNFRGVDECWVDIDILLQWRPLSLKNQRTVSNNLKERVWDRFGIGGVVWVLGSRKRPHPHTPGHYMMSYMISRKRDRLSVNSRRLQREQREEEVQNGT